MPTTWFSPARLAVPTAAAVGLALVAGLAAAPAGAAPATASTTRLVAGTTTVTDDTGATWSPDSSAAIGGQLETLTGEVRGTSQPKLFASVRSGQAGYRIPVSARTEIVSLGFADQRWTKPGQRVFDVLAEGRVVADDVDVVASAGRMSAFRLTFPVRVDDGYLDLVFSSRVDVPVLANLKIVSSGAPSPAEGRTRPAAAVLSPESYGAVGDGVTDDTAALQRAFDGAPTGQPIVLTPGRTYAHSGVLHLRKKWLQVTGAGTLLATDERTSSVWIEADNVVVDGGVVVKLRASSGRWSAWEQMGVRIVGRTGVTLRSITVDGSAAAGIYVGNGAANFVLDRVTVQNTRADGIHMTGGANRGTVLSPVVRNSGDDGVAVVSYQQDGPACHDISVVSPTVLGTTWGRGISVVGGTRITETNINVQNTSAAAVYIASEGSPWFTTAPQQVMINGGTISGANTNTGVDHGAVLVLSGQKGAVVPNSVTVQNLQISGTRPTASRNLGVITYGDAPRGVLFNRITITGGPRAYQGNTPATAYRLLDVVRDGVAVPIGG